MLGVPLPGLISCCLASLICQQPLGRKKPHQIMEMIAAFVFVAESLILDQAPACQLIQMLMSFIQANCFLSLSIELGWEYGKHPEDPGSFEREQAVAQAEFGEHILIHSKFA